MHLRDKYASIFDYHYILIFKAISNQVQKLPLEVYYQVFNQRLPT